MQQWLTGLSGAAAILAAIFAFLTKRAETRASTETSNVQQVFEAMESHMTTLSSENEDLRRRQAKTEESNRELIQEVGLLRLEVAGCEADKKLLRLEVKQLKERLDG